ncbi:hypothetical protein PAL_GLEAN10016056 [Pteropus alecto]|uniref:Uncharacterized protein n=1 Tax=Pteropus alecto TaxID=9402 RepID=L5JWC9_PTEAL|nr:hypothetical protein PAL_GLEAN10016056 [Pteropus alecto]
MRWNWRSPLGPTSGKETSRPSSQPREPRRSRPSIHNTPYGVGHGYAAGPAPRSFWAGACGNASLGANTPGYKILIHYREPEGGPLGKGQVSYPAAGMEMG